MAMAAGNHAHTCRPARDPRTEAAIRLAFPCRARAAADGRTCTVTLAAAGGLSGRGSGGAAYLPRPGRSASLAAVAAFLADATCGVAPDATLSRMIGRYAQAAGDAPAMPLEITLSTSRGTPVSLRLETPCFEIERTGFGAAHILHEDDTLGLYVLEIAPGRSIPAHCHRVMREWELILDEGLLLQDRPVARGAAMAWPLGHVHAYRNPTPLPLRILCIDSPRFTPADEEPLNPPPPLAPLAPFAEYPV